MPLDNNSIAQLEKTSRTFFIPIMRLPQNLQDAVGSAYLCMRAIDQIEDHRALTKEQKINLLGSISHIFQAANHTLDHDRIQQLFAPFGESLPEVTRSLSEYAIQAPDTIAHRIWDATSAMADRMSAWVACDWSIDTKADLDAYTYSVAGAIGLLLSDLWSWHDGTRVGRANAVAFGRGLQAVNILRNREEDLQRGVDFYPNDWSNENMITYIQEQLSLADQYIEELGAGPASEFCRIPLSLARGTVDAIVEGREKLSRADVIQLVEACTGMEGRVP